MKYIMLMIAFVAGIQFSTAYNREPQIIKVEDNPPIKETRILEPIELEVISYAKEDVKTPRNANFNVTEAVCEVFKDDCNVAIAVAKAESGLNPNAVGDTHLSKPSYGLFQINRIFHDYTVEELLDPEINIKVARDISSKGRGWENWTTYRNGQYKEFLNN